MNRNGHPDTVTFILSSDRSGSTWAGYVLGSHSQSAFLGEFWRAWNPGIRTPCSWCSLRGEVCPILDGVEKYHQHAAFEAAFSRIKQPFLIDSSKRVEWAQEFALPHTRYQVRAVHLLRDPRGWYASERRRQPTRTLRDLLAHWVDENVAIRSFLKRSAIPYQTAFYDELAQSPAEEFPRLCAFVGFPFEPGSLNYWERVHHGFAANGASSFLFPDRPSNSQAGQLVTGDDVFYRNRERLAFVDLRWKQQLSEAELLAITSNRDAAALLNLYDRALSPSGMQRHAFASTT